MHWSMFSPVGSIRFLSAQRFLLSPRARNINQVAKTAESVIQTKDQSASEEWNKAPWERRWKQHFSFGFDKKDPVSDRYNKNMFFFFTVTICMVIFPVVWHYNPDRWMKKWFHREAYLELARREARGGPLVDPDFIPAHLIILPTEEELGDTEIVI